MSDSSSRPRILAVGPTPPPINGMSVATSFLLRTAVAESHGVRLIDTADRRGLGNVGRFDVGNVVGALKVGVQFWWALLTLRPDVVYVPIAQNTLGFLRDALFLVPARLSRARVVVHVHGGHFGRFFESAGGGLRALIRFCLTRAHTAIVLGDCLRAMLEDVVAPDRIEVVPNGIEDMTEDAKSLWSHGDPVVLWMSKLDKEKGYEDVLHTLPIVQKAVPSVRYVFAGEWLDRQSEEEARTWVEEHAANACVEFAGAVGPPDKYDLLAGASVFVLPTRYRYEGQPYAILEAMSFSVPVVTSPAGCISETVVPGLTGLFVEPGSTVELAEEIVALLENPEEAAAMGEAARERFLEHYTFAVWDSRMSRILVDAAKRK